METMADSDKSFFTNLVSESEKRIKDHVDDKIDGLKENLDLKLKPVIEKQEEQKQYIKKLETSVESANNKFLHYDHKFEKVDSKIQDQGKRFGGLIDGVTGKIDGHIDRHKEKEKEKKGNKKSVKNWVMGIAGSVIGAVVIYILLDLIIKKAAG